MLLVPGRHRDDSAPGALPPACQSRLPVERLRCTSRPRIRVRSSSTRARSPWQAGDAVALFIAPRHLMEAAPTLARLRSHQRFPSFSSSSRHAHPPARSLAYRRSTPRAPRARRASVLALRRRLRGRRDRRPDRLRRPADYANCAIARALAARPTPDRNRDDRARQAAFAGDEWLRRIGDAFCSSGRPRRPAIGGDATTSRGAARRLGDDRSSALSHARRFSRRATIVAMHHPPFARSSALDEIAGCAARTLWRRDRRHRRSTRRLGHLHRAIRKRFAGTIALYGAVDRPAVRSTFAVRGIGVRAEPRVHDPRLDGFGRGGQPCRLQRPCAGARSTTPPD